jgi:hypothetical protein
MFIIGLQISSLSRNVIFSRNSKSCRGYLRCSPLRSVQHRYTFSLTSFLRLILILRTTLCQGLLSSLTHLTSLPEFYIRIYISQIYYASSSWMYSLSEFHNIKYGRITRRISHTPLAEAQQSIGPRGTVVGCGTMLQVKRSRVRVR